MRVKRANMIVRIVKAAEEERERRNQMEVLLRTVLQSHSHLQQIQDMMERTLGIIESCDAKNAIHAEAGDMLVSAPQTLTELAGEIAAIEYMVMEMMSPDVREFIPRALKDQWKQVSATSHLPGDKTPHTQPNNREVVEQFYLQTTNDGGQSVQDKEQYPVQESIYDQDQAWQRAKISPGGPSADQRDWSDWGISYPSTSIPKNIRR